MANNPLEFLKVIQNLQRNMGDMQEKLAAVRVRLDIDEAEPLERGADRTMVLVDPNLRSLPTCDIVVDSLKRQKIDYEIFDAISVEPTDASFQRAAEAATEGNFDCFVAVGSSQ